MSRSRTGRTGRVMVMELMFKQGNVFLTLCDKHAGHRATKTRKWMSPATFPKSKFQNEAEETPGPSHFEIRAIPL